ncbi:CGNR zinc finger domain-containing protein [Cohnella herbarum]|uniref:CGNR zinc finger domain-containing protein n=1 Tax=Cohnella herbarum TaxID=2728023 RepID=A0A7Z2ZJZ6_9BACL|nr:CGNR zinc finger domain-containing protein [Cohnella herbarum]QJD82686.1 CGNR zinc finger domain-containing protein [Cohnella herbarum]
MHFTYYESLSVNLAVDLINTLCPVTDTDNLSTPEQLTQFLVESEKHVLDLVSEKNRGLDGDAVIAVLRNTVQSWHVRSEDVENVRALRKSLRTAFELAKEQKAQDIAVLLNERLRLSGATPRISWHHGPYHLHFESAEDGCAHWLATTTAMGLAFVLIEFGTERFGICASASCQKAYIDTSKNKSKRYCSEACAHRESVAAFRKRQRSKN